MMQHPLLCIIVGIGVKTEQVLRVLLTSGRKAEQQISPQASQASPSLLLLSFSTGSEQEPVLRSRWPVQRED